MRYLLDTNILRNITKPAQSASQLAWMNEQNDEDLFIERMTDDNYFGSPEFATGHADFVFE